MSDIPYVFLRAIVTGGWLCLMTSGIHGSVGAILLIIGIVGLIFTWTYKMKQPRRVR